MLDSICVIGAPSRLGGADTELYDQIKCWNMMGIKTYILHTAPLRKSSRDMKTVMESKYNCVYLKPRQWHLCKDMHCISFCNGEFLTNLPKIRNYAKTTTFVNCMTWNFKKEIECQKNGMIDFHLYQTDHAKSMVSKKLKSLGDYRPIRFDPYFDPDEFSYHADRPNDMFRFGRISRRDMAKFSRNQFDIYDSIDSPVDKAGLVLGWGDTIMTKIPSVRGKISTTNVDGFSVQTYNEYIQLLKESSISQQDFYNFCDVMIMAADTFENLPRVGFEAMSSGSVMIVNDRGGWRNQIDDGKTGFLCKTQSDFIENATILANNPNQKEDMRNAAREKLMDEWGMQRSMDSWSQVFDQIARLR